MNKKYNNPHNVLVKWQDYRIISNSIAVSWSWRYNNEGIVLFCPFPFVHKFLKPTINSHEPARKTFKRTSKIAQSKNLIESKTQSKLSKWIVLFSYSLKSNNLLILNTFDGIFYLDLFEGEWELPSQNQLKLIRQI